MHGAFCDTEIITYIAFIGGEIMTCQYHAIL